jgi:hypothetical protein
MNEVASRVDNCVAIDTESVKSIHNIDKLKVAAHTDIGDSMVTSIADEVLSYDPEAMIWQDSPSTSLMLPSILEWMVITVIWVFALNFLSPEPDVTSPIVAKPSVQNQSKAQNSKGKTEKNVNSAEDGQASSKAKSVPTKKPAQEDTAFIWTLIIGVLILLYQVFGHIRWYLKIKSTKYKMSSQRITIESGIFSKVVATYELHKLQNGQVFKPWNLRLFGRDNLYVSGVPLNAIKNAEAVRDLIRNAGQIEASRVEKARFR